MSQSRATQGLLEGASGSSVLWYAVAMAFRSHLGTLSVTWMVAMAAACGGTDETVGIHPHDCPAGEVLVDGVCVAGGCPDGQVELPDGTCHTPPCADDELQIDEQCMPVGLPEDLPCPPGEQLVGVDCEPAGVTSDGCATGFVHDGDRGCQPILPEAPCPTGQLAVPGDTECREVAACGTGPWGDIPVDSTTVYVDGAYSGGSSNGTANAPFTGLSQAITAAPAGALVAIAAGTYSGSITLSNKPVRLWGRCPSMVELVGDANQSGAVNIHAGADGAELHNLAITGPNLGLAHFGSSNVLAERLWIHDCGMEGSYSEDEQSEVQLTLRDSLVEHNAAFAISSFGATVIIEGCLIRGTQAQGGEYGWGVVAATSPNDGESGTLTVSGSLIDDNRHLGLWVGGSNLSLEGTVVRGTLSEGNGSPAEGLWLMDGSVGALTSSVIEDNSLGGLSLVGSQAVLTSMVVRRSAGFGVYSQPGATGHAADLTLQSSLVEDHQTGGLALRGTTATIGGTAIRATDALPIGGTGIDLSFDLDLASPSVATIRDSLVERAGDHGMLILGSGGTIESTVVRATQPRADGRHGSGIIVQDALELDLSASGVVRTSLLEDNHEVSLLVSGAQLVIEDSEVRRSLPSTFRWSGRGIHAQDNPTTGNVASASLYSVLVEQSVVAGVHSLDSDLFIERVIVRDTAADSSDGTYGDGIGATSLQGLGHTEVLSSKVVTSERAACATFGARMTLGQVSLACQAIDIDGEALLGQDFELQNQGGNLCGCPVAIGECQLLSAGIAPPPPLSD